jgi:LPS sulfotransferase NodH
MTTSLRKRLSLAWSILLKGAPAARGRQEVPAITAEEVAEVKAFFPMEKFFIFGHARSGTTLLARLIRLHPKVHCNYQAHFFTRPPLLQSLVASPEIEGWLKRRSNRWNNGRDLSPLVLRAAADLIMERDARREGKTIVGDKSPSSLLDGEAVRLMVKVYPDARLVYILRDGRDTALSHRFQAFIDSPQHLDTADLRIRADFTKDPGPYLRGERSVFTEKGIRQAAQGWVKNVQESEATGRQLLGANYLSLRYEDLLARPWEEMRRVWFFLGADPEQAGLQAQVEREMAQNPDADWQQQKASEIASPLQKGKQGSWREMFTASDRKIFTEIAGETLRQWGYLE